MYVSQRHRETMEALARSSRGVFLVAEMLHADGYTAIVPPIRYAPSAALHADYADEGDLLTIKNAKMQRWEVKRLTACFRGPADFPYPVLFVGNVERIDRAREPIEAIYALSGDLRCVAIVRRATGASWRKQMTRVRNSSALQHNYACPLSSIEWVMVPDEILWRGLEAA